LQDRDEGQVRCEVAEPQIAGDGAALMLVHRQTRSLEYVWFDHPFTARQRCRALMLIICGRGGPGGVCWA
jgi:hypothetical protein